MAKIGRPGLPSDKRCDTPIRAGGYTTQLDVTCDGNVTHVSSLGR